MNVVIYARYSSHNQTEQSIEGQIAICTEYAKRNDYTIIGEYIDRAITGTTDSRPQFQKMIEDSSKRCFQGVLVYQLDRFARNRYDSAIYKNKLKKNGIRVFSAKENISDDASGVLMESVLEGMAEYYSVELSQKVRRGMDINAQKCLSLGGIPTLGYKINKEKRYEIDEPNAIIVRKIFDMYLNGKIMSEIIKYLNDNGIKTSHGNEFNKSSIRRILINKKYIGIYTYKGKDTKDGVPRIIDDNTFYRVQEIMEHNKKAPARAKAKTEYLLTTKLFCGTCKEMMVGICGTSRDGTVHNYYSCNGKRKHICKRKNVRKEFIEDLVVKYAREVLTDENIHKIATETIKLIENEKQNSILKYFERELNEKEKEQINLMNSLKLCNIDSVRQAIFEELEKIDYEIKDIKNSILIENSKNIELSESQIEFFLTQIKNGNIDDIKYKKMLITILIDKIYLYDGNLTIIFNLQNTQNTTINVPTIDEIECSFIDESGQPKQKRSFHRNESSVFVFHCALFYSYHIDARKAGCNHACTIHIIKMHQKNLCAFLA